MGIRCGSCGQRHDAVADVRSCYALEQSQREDIEGLQRAEAGYVRFLENAGSAEAELQDRMEAQRGVTSFSDAWDAADPSRIMDRLAAEADEDERQATGSPFGFIDAPYETRGEREARQARSYRVPSVTEAGIYRTPGGEIYKVQKAIHGSGHPYAKHLKKLDAPRTLKNGQVRAFEFVYAPGSLAQLRPEWKLTLEQCQEFGALYGTCVRCGLTLTREDSIERRMGSTCFSKASAGEW